jgi:hypothetical protein
VLSSTLSLNRVRLRARCAAVSLGGVQEGLEAGHVRAHIVSPFQDLRAEVIHEGLGVPAAMEGGRLCLHCLLPWSIVSASLGCRCAKTGTSSVYLGDPC